MCLLMDDSMSPDFLIDHFWCHIGAYFCYGWDLPTFTELHAYPHLRGMRWDDDVFVVSWWSFSGASVEPFIQVRISWHWFVFMFFIPRDVPWMFGFGLDPGDHMSDDRWLHITRFMIYRTFDATLGHISASGEIFRSPWIYMIIPTHRVRAETTICSLVLWRSLSGASR